MKPRFLLDENLDPALRRGLQRLDTEIDVLAVGDAGAPPKGTLDPDLLIWLEEHNYILVTANRRSMPGHLAQHYQAGRSLPGVFWIRPNTTLGAMVQALYQIWTTSMHEEYRHRNEYIP